MNFEYLFSKYYTKGNIESLHEHTQRALLRFLSEFSRPQRVGQNHIFFIIIHKELSFRSCASVLLSSSTSPCVLSVVSSCFFCGTFSPREIIYRVLEEPLHTSKAFYWLRFSLPSLEFTLYSHEATQEGSILR